MITVLRRIPRPPATDVAIAAAFVALGQAMAWLQFDSQMTWQASRPHNAVMSLLFMTTLAWRRRAPLAALAAALMVYFLPALVVPHDVTFLTGGVPLILLTASAAYYCPRRRALLAAVLGLIALGAASLVTPDLRHWDALAWNSGFLLVPWACARGMREREDRAATLATELATERATRAIARREAAAEERAHIARELHDIVAHRVSMMVIQTGAARMHLPAGATGAETALLDAEDAGRQTLDDLRRLLGLLRTEASPDPGATGPSPPQPGLAELDALVAPVRGTGLEVELEVHGRQVALPAALELTAYRIVQEALTNTLKHGGASRVTIRLAYAPTSLQIEVADDGRDGPPGSGTGHGLLGIEERVALFGGSVAAGPGPQGGWQLRTDLPMPVAPGASVTALPAP